MGGMVVWLKKWMRKGRRTENSGCQEGQKREKRYTEFA